ncbi:MAG: HAMP domain-containing protein, partial [Proteobacteria bacterium]|nr:HAMP domain-containing protein [Pseudomonadota bacterium]
IFLGIVLGRTVIMPLETLAAHAERISRGNLNQKIEIDSEDEFGSLATTLNRMQAGLRTAIIRLKNR